VCAQNWFRVCGLRWPVETTLEEGKDELGMDHYEVRSWVGWHHHMAHTFRAHLFLIRLCLLLKKSPALTLAQARQLIARALADEQEKYPDVLATITYRQQRNYAAYCSHRRRTLKQKG
jgi:SRSO17 transposase